MAELEFDQDKMYANNAFAPRKKTRSSLSGVLIRMGITRSENGANSILAIFALLIIAFAVYISWPEPEPINIIELIPGESIGVFL